MVFLVRLTGLEPAHRETLDPKSNASTNFATGAIAQFVSLMAIGGVRPDAHALCGAKLGLFYVMSE